jgi:multiple sugar transport system substrate-binding protein
VKRQRHICRLSSILVLLAFLAACSLGPADPVTLRLGVALTPQELSTFEPLIQALDDANPAWEIIIENTPQQGAVEKLNAQLASQTLPDIVRVQGLFAQGWIRQGAFLDLGQHISDRGLELSDFYEGPLDQFRWQESIWGLPDTAAPTALYYNKAMFDAAGLGYPTDSWTYEDMRTAARLLTLDTSGRNSTGPAFDPSAIVQWGWNSSLNHVWQREAVRGLGGECCLNDNCTLMSWTDPKTLAAAQWWASLVNQDHSALYDPWGGAQTGVPGDAFIAGKAAMGYNGFFAVGQLNEVGSIGYEVAQPLLAADGKRYSSLSTNGYVISANSEHPEQAWELIEALLEPEFLSNAWGKPGHSVPSRRSAAASAIDLSHPPANQQAFISAMEYGEVFKPFTGAAFEVYGKTLDTFRQAMTGELSVEEAMGEIERTANEILARDRGE